MPFPACWIKLGVEQPSPDKMYPISLGGDLIGNTIYYSQIGAADGDKVWLRGGLLGLGAGLRAVFLPGQLGLNEEPTNRTTQTQVMTVAWYLFGRLVAAAVAKLLDDEAVK